ncbi:MAG: hypothetical protein VW907_07730 [Opitutae bacterium]
MLINAHRLGQTYGKLPSEILNRNYSDYLIDLEAYNIGSKQDKADADREARKQKR